MVDLGLWSHRDYPTFYSAHQGGMSLYESLAVDHGPFSRVYPSQNTSPLSPPLLGHLEGPEHLEILCHTAEHRVLEIPDFAILQSSTSPAGICIPSNLHAPHISVMFPKRASILHWSLSLGSPLDVDSMLAK